MWLEIGLLHIFKEGEMFIVHTYTSRGPQRRSRYKVISNGESHYRTDIIISFNKVQNYYKSLTLYKNNI